VPIADGSAFLHDTHDGHQRGGSVLINAPPLGQRNLLVVVANGSEVVSHFVESSTEAVRRVESTEASHWVVALLDAAMVLLNRVVDMFSCAVLNIIAELFLDCTWIGTMAIGRGLRWRIFGHLQSRSEERLCSLHVSILAQPTIYKIPVLIDGSIEVTPLPGDSDIGLVNEPSSADASTTPSTKL
jgi:hypothetical protein